MLILCVCVLLILQESVELLGQFKEFMVKYNKVYSSQEGEVTEPNICIYSSVTFLSAQAESFMHSQPTQSNNKRHSTGRKTSEESQMRR